MNVLSPAALEQAAEVALIYGAAERWFSYRDAKKQKAPLIKSKSLATDGGDPPSLKPLTSSQVPFVTGNCMFVTFLVPPIVAYVSLA